MAPSSFQDLGKDARDLFSKGFHAGILKLDLKSVAENKVEFKVSGTHNIQGANATDAKLETKGKCCHGLTFTEAWDTKNVLSFKADWEDQLAKGLKITFDSSFNTASYAKDAKLKTVYKHDNATIEIDSGLSLAAPVINASGLFAHNNWVLGGSMGLDTGKQTITKSQLAVGYVSKDLKVHSYVKDATEFGSTVYHKVNDSTEVGVTVGWQGSNVAATRFALAAKHKICDASHVNIAVDNKSIVNVGYTNSVKKGVKLTGSFLLDAKAVSGGDHKVGLGLDFEL